MAKSRTLQYLKQKAGASTNISDSMTATHRLFIALLALFCAGLAPSLRAEAVGFPKDKPALTIEVPAGWKVDWIEASGSPSGPTLQLMSAGEEADLSIKALPESAAIVDEASAKANLTRVALLDMQEMEATKSTAAEETTVAGHKAYKTKLTTAIGFMEYTIFTPDGKSYFAMFSLNGGAAPVIAAIKPAG